MIGGIMPVLEETIEVSRVISTPRRFKEIPDGYYRDPVTKFVTNVKPKRKYVKPTIQKETEMKFPEELINSLGKVVCRQCAGCHGCR